MKFDCYINPEIFGYIIPNIQKSGLLNSISYQERVRKTACFYGQDFNVYIDGSDGQSIEWGTQDPCERILWIVKDTGDKPFLFFKNWYDPTTCKDIQKVVDENNGKLIPFMFWHYYPYFQKYWSSRKNFNSQYKNTSKTIDIGVAAEAKKYYDYNPSKFDSRMSWKGYEWFGHGPAVDMGMNEHSARIDIIEKIKWNKKYTHEHVYGISFDRLVEKSMHWKTHYDMPGVATISFRMFEAGWLGQCVILRKSNLDFPYSWKEYYPELDYNSNTWENDLGEILENYEEWGDKIKYYLETYCTPETIVNYFIGKIYEGI